MSADFLRGTHELIAVEVKTSDDEQLVNAPARASHADSQIRNTLEAVQDGLGAAGAGQTSPLSIPRCEMLKHTLVRAAQARSGDPEADRANRIRWGAWLTELFGQTTPNVTLSGCLVSVLLRRTAPSIEEKLDTPGPWTIVHRILGEKDAGDLLGQKTAFSDLQQETVSTPRATTENSLQPIDPNLMDSSETPDQVHPGLTSNDNVRVSSSGEKPPFVNDVIRDRAVPLSPSDAKLDEHWPPAVNKLEMIGQYEAVERLVEQALFSKDMGKRFPDKLLVGPAGVGKSTLARKIGTLLLGCEPLFFNGADLRRPSEIVDKIVQENLLENNAAGRAASISPCLIFIDEVHGISNAVATVLLSAMDDRRTTTIEGRMYDFNRVVLLLATTDPGRLSEAFQSRPSKTWLRPYTLHELAGIVWLHGKECLDGAELARDVCYEIAARNRCNPRRSVRELGETLVPHFFQRAKAEQRGKTVSLKDTAAIMTCEQIAEFYEKQGVDLNGLDNLAKLFLRYLKERGSCSESTLRQGLGLAHSQDFVEAAEYLVRLGLIETSTAGRRLTQTGERYLRSAIPLDLRERISRAGP